MKKLFLLVVMCFVALSGNAQNFLDNYIYSAGGFKIITVECPYSFDPEKGAKPGYDPAYSVGLYTSDGKTLVQAHNYTGYTYFFVKEGTEIIASNAFSAGGFKNIIIPTSVKYIAPDVLEKTKICGFYDSTKEVSSSTSTKAVEASEATEVARYNLNGQRIDEPEHGINIIQMSDNTAKKVYVK